MGRGIRGDYEKNTACHQTQTVRHSACICEGLDEELGKCGYHQPIYIMIGIDLSEHQTSAFGARTEDAEAR